MPFQIPLDLPHAGRIADRILSLLERQAEARGIDAGEAIETAERISNLLFRYSANDENPPEAEWASVREAENLCPSATIGIEEDDAGESPAAASG